MHKGMMTEVLTIEDTPEPGTGTGAGPSGSGSGTGSMQSGGGGGSQFHQLQEREPAAKRRRNDGAHISDQPYASGSSYSYEQNGGEGSGYHQNNKPLPPPPTGNGTLQKKRKLAQDPDGYSGRDNGAAAPTSTGSRSDLPSADKEGHFIVRINDLLHKKRYRIVRPLGQGTFGKVVAAYDANTDKEVAVKIIRAVAKYREASRVEIRVLQLLRDKDPLNRYKCIHSQDVFDHLGHICIVSELLSSSVFDFLKENSYQPFPFSQIQHFASQLLRSVEFLHGLDLIHTDLKPENILLEAVDSFTVPLKPGSKKTKNILKNSNIRLIDFGSATFESDYHATVVSTRHYRAPEIILGMGWSFPCDVWSIGCILIEFYTGEALFQTHENLEHLAMMQKVFGVMPDRFAQDAAKLHEEWFKKSETARGRNSRPIQVLAFPQADTSKQSKKFVAQMRTLKDLIQPESGIEAQRFLHLLEGLLRWEPADRLKVKEALKHPFFGLKMHDEGNSR